MEIQNCSCQLPAFPPELLHPPDGCCEIGTCGTDDVFVRPIVSDILVRLDPHYRLSLQATQDRRKAQVVAFNEMPHAELMELILMSTCCCI